MSQNDKTSAPVESPSTMLRERQLARRWDTSQRTLQRWRSEGQGPPYIRIGGSIRYLMADVLAYEQQRRCGEDQQ